MTADPVSTIRRLDELVGGLEGARRRNLQAVRNRMAAELTGDVTAVLETLAPTFHLVTVTPDGTRTVRPGGVDVVRAGFEALCGGGTTTIWAEWDHLAVDEQAFIGVGTTRMVMSGETAAAMGHRVPDPSVRYSLRSFATVVVDFDEHGRMTRETLVADPDATGVSEAGPDEAFDNLELATHVRQLRPAPNTRPVRESAP